MPRQGYAAFGLSIDTLWTWALQRAGRIAAYCFNPHPGGVRFALAPPPDRVLSPPRHIAEVRTSLPQNGKCAAARARKSLAPAHEPAGPSRPAYGGVRLQGSGFHKRVAHPSLSSAKNSPTARSRLRRSVLAGRKGRARHRHRSGLKIPPRPLSAPASPAKAGHVPCFIGPPALQKSAPDYRRLHPLRDARLGTCEEKKRPGAVPGRRFAASGQIHDHLFTRIFDLWWTPYSRLRASSVTCASMRSF